MDLSSRRWGVSATLSLVAAGLLALAAFLPLFIGDSDIATSDRAVAFGVTVTGWDGGGLSTAYQQLSGAGLALTAGLFAAFSALGTGRKGNLVLVVASGAFNIGVASMVGSLLRGYFALYPAYDGPEGRITSQFGVGFWCLVAGLILALAAVVVVLPRRAMDLADRHWGMGAVLSLVAAALLTLAVFLPYFQTGWNDANTTGDTTQVTVTAWGTETTVSTLPGFTGPESSWYASGYQHLFGVALALAGGLLAARRTARARSSSVVFLVAAGAFNVGVITLLVPMLDVAVDAFPASSWTDWRIFDFGPGYWSLLAGVLFSVLATVAALSRKRASSAAVSTTAAP